MPDIPLMHVEDLKERMDANTTPVILDVREPYEYSICNLGGVLIPLNDLPRRVGELDPNRETVVHCRTGGRSAMAVEFLMANGFKNVKNLAGGILSWSAKIDPSMPQY